MYLFNYVRSGIQREFILPFQTGARMLVEKATVRSGKNPSPDSISLHLVNINYFAIHQEAIQCISLCYSSCQDV